MEAPVRSAGICYSYTTLFTDLLRSVFSGYVFYRLNLVLLFVSFVVHVIVWSMFQFFRWVCRVISRYCCCRCCLSPTGYKGLIKGEALILLRTNSSAKSLYENIYNFKKRLRARDYPHNNLIEKITSEVKFTERKSALQKNNEVRKKILPFVTTYHPALPNLKKHFNEQMAVNSRSTTT